LFVNRQDAGARLAAALTARDFDAPVVLALPRGGVPVAFEVAGTLRAPLDLVLVRKVGVPSQRELAAAAVVDGATPVVVYNRSVMHALDLSEQDLAKDIAREIAEIARRRALYLRGRSAVPISGRTVIVIDDGIATGTTVRAALTALRQQRPSRLVLAVPVAAPDTLQELEELTDEIICLERPARLRAVGLYYSDFAQLEDAEVIDLLDRHSARMPPTNT
jgi:putative phosphoribosyl transferase